MMKQLGVILAGGSGSRLGELTKVTNKHLLPVGNVPMVYHPIKKLVEVGITNIMLITSTEHMGDFISLLGSGKRLGCNLTYRVQEEAGGIAQALSIAKSDYEDTQYIVLLADNIFTKPLTDLISMARISEYYAGVYIYRILDNHRFGVPEICYDNLIVNIEEKPLSPKSGYAIPGIYFYPPDVFDVIKTLKPSARNELEITDVNNFYAKAKRLQHITLTGFWTDAGTPSSYWLANKVMNESNN